MLLSFFALMIAYAAMLAPFLFGVQPARRGQRKAVPPAGLFEIKEYSLDFTP
jgi:hypothetical protein